MAEISQRPEYDVCIVGSGAGGGMAAYVLTKSGANVALIEAGPEWYSSKDSKMLVPAYASMRRGAGCGGVRFTFDIPAADAAVEFAEGFLAGPGTPAHGRVGRHEHLGVLAAVPLGAGLDQCDVGTGLGQDVGRHASARAGTYNTDIVLWPLRNFCHPFLQAENMRDSSIVWCAREDSARPVRSQRLQD